MDPNIHHKLRKENAMPKPSFKMMTLTIGSETTKVVNEEQVKAYLKGRSQPYDPYGHDIEWSDGFVSGLNSAGVLTKEQYEDLMAFVARM